LSLQNQAGRILNKQSRFEIPHKPASFFHYILRLHVGPGIVLVRGLGFFKVSGENSVLGSSFTAFANDPIASSNR
jgi:hypothetical protein